MSIPKKPRIHVLYKITSLTDAYYYIGIHSTFDINDDYLGSGRIIRRAIKKHGKENFRKEILEICASRSKLLAREKEVVNADLLNDPLCTNLKIGGSGTDSATWLRIWDRPGYRENQSNNLKARWANPDNALSMGKALSNTISGLSEEEKIKRLRMSCWSGDQEKRALSIKRGKSSLMQVTKPDGTKIEFNSLDSESIAGITYAKIKYFLRYYGGVDKSTNNLYSYIKKYGEHAAKN